MRRAAMVRRAALAALAMLAAAPAWGQAISPDVRRYGDFVVRCATAKSVAPCDLFEERLNKETNQRVISLSVGYMPSQSRYIMQIAVPLGVSLEKGVVISAGKFTSPAFPFRRCDGTGCYVEAGITRNLIDAFAKSGNDAKFKVYSDAGKEFDFGFSFAGFAAAHDDMVSQNKAKAINPDSADTLSAPSKP